MVRFEAFPPADAPSDPSNRAANVRRDDTSTWARPQGQGIVSLRISYVTRVMVWGQGVLEFSRALSMSSANIILASALEGNSPQPKHLARMS